MKDINETASTIKFPLIFDNNNEKGEYHEMTIELEPINLDWEDDLSLLELKQKLGISPKRKLKKIEKIHKYLCVLCQKHCRGQKSLISHYLIHKEETIKINTNKINETEDNDFLHCTICMEEFVEKTELEKHAKFHITHPYYCDLCKKSYKQSQNFLTHMNAHEKLQEPIKCTYCTFESFQKSSYDRHLKVHLREEYRCDLCNKVFPARTWFLEHKNFHTGEKPFSCEDCGKCFLYSRYLMAHKKSMHYITDPSSTECKICHKRYSHKNSLRLHMKSHSGDNVHLCDVCGKSLSSTDKLQLHKRIHTGYKPYACNICEKAFTKKDILTDHLRVHSGEKPFACEICGKCFSQRSPLTIHRRYHTGERPYVCHLCNKGFVSKGILSIHLKQGKH